MRVGLLQSRAGPCSADSTAHGKEKHVERDELGTAEQQKLLHARWSVRSTGFAETLFYVCWKLFFICACNLREAHGLNLDVRFLK